ncbi:(Fe-S)-binding protein [Paenibacillus sp. J31TS4]|uniref:(Fe-S)-binding protein n=1 Tax=Paenibacillus sp. J31TS4 TaxID=2807195 RepID=UPI001BCF8CBD|nr:(Fe-S)-binding protein [Paenibacillus sp. J31TS4]
MARKPVNPLAEALKQSLDYEELTNCMRCGFCQPACPTFTETGIEAASPRGRIALMKAVADGLMEPDQAFKDQLDLCLGCRACEPVCPSDVKYGHLLEQARDTIEEYAEHRPQVKLVRTVMLKHVFPKQKLMKLVGAGLATYQKSGLRWVARNAGIMKLFPENLRQMERILPDATPRGVVERIGEHYPAKGEPIARVAMFRGCLMDVLFTETNVNTVKLLSEAGFEVVIPRTQNCCGALHAHSGEQELARELARKNIRAFREAGVDYIVSNAGGCGALLMEYDHLLKDDPAYAEDAKWFAERVKDVSEMLYDIGRVPSFREPGMNNGEEKALTITYQDSCHLRNVMRASNAPRKLMREVKNVRYVELKNADKCCGSAGTYNLVQPEMSTQILDHKMEHVKATDARYLLTSNPGCLLQMKLGIERESISGSMQALHLVDFLYDRLEKKETGATS